MKLLKIMCQVLGQQQNLTYRLETSSTPGNRTNTVKYASVDVTNNCTNLLDYFSSNTNKEAGIEAGRIYSKMIHSSQVLTASMSHSSCRLKRAAAKFTPCPEE